MLLPYLIGVVQPTDACLIKKTTPTATRYLTRQGSQTEGFFNLIPEIFIMQQLSTGQVLDLASK